MKNKKNLITIIAISVILVVLLVSVVINKTNNKTQNNTNISQVSLEDIPIEQLKEFNQKLDEYYVRQFEGNRFLSYFSYFVKNDRTEVTINDIEEALSYKVPEEIKNVTLHFVKPKSLKPYLGDKIIDDDPEILTVYSALPVKEGVFISSKFDEGGLLSESDYKKFVTDHSWIHGDIRKPEKTDNEYKEIIKAIEEKSPEMIGGNVKHMFVDDKYAIVVIGSKDYTNLIKEYALQKNQDGSYNIIVEDLEQRDSKIYVNYAYTDFSLDLLPLYELSMYKNQISEYKDMEQILKDNKEINENDKLTYSCGVDNFIYLEFESNTKMLLYKNENGQFDIYQVDNFKTALSQMLNLQDNPPAFILKFE